jgi:valyl-tRNA synthetase
MIAGGDMIEQENNILSSLPKTYEPQAVEGKWYRFWEGMP